MSEAFDPTIATLQATLKKLEQRVRETRRVINQVSEHAGLPMPYPDAETDSVASQAENQRDRYYGLPLATAITKYLEGRRATGRGPATVNEIYSALTAGGFVFDTSNEANAKRGVYISLAKNSVTFHKLPGGTGEAAIFGMLSWYPNAKGADDDKKPKGKRRKPKPKAESEPVEEVAPTPPSKPRVPAAKPGKGAPS